MNLPNTLTVLRMVGVPLLLWLLFSHQWGGALWLFLALAVTDALDGFIAKRFNLCTPLGALLDPVADMLLLVSSFLALAHLGQMPWWVAMLVVGRNLVVAGGAWSYYRLIGPLTVDPTPLGKLTTGVQVTCLGLVLLGAAHGVGREWLPAVLWITAGVTVVSGVAYVVVWSHKARQAWAR